MTIITINGVALVEVLEPVFRIALIIMFVTALHMILKLFMEAYEDNKKRKQKEEVQQIYTARKRQFEGNEIGWKKWRDANYKITDLVEVESYF